MAASAVPSATPSDTPLLPARPRASFRTRNRDEAVESVERLYGPHTLELKSRGVLDMRLSGLDVARLNLSSIEYGCPATAHTPLPHDHWVFSTCLRGEIVVDRSCARAGYSGVRPPEETCDVPMSADLQLLNLKVARTDLDEAWCMLLGERADRPISFLALAPDGSAQTELLRRLMRRLEETPSYPSAHAPLLERRLQEATLLELLMAWPHSHSRYLQRADAARGSTERALQYIHANAAEVPTLGEIAQAAGVGVRALMRGFEKRLGVSPVRYLLHWRLDRARAELLDAAPGTGTVTDIALRWGFGNLGDFAARYRSRFGELPRTTLQRSR
jgi:AraC-like DNA-binding protein